MTSRLSILSTPKGKRDVGECGLKVPPWSGHRSSPSAFLKLARGRADRPPRQSRGGAAMDRFRIWFANVLMKTNEWADKLSMVIVGLASLGFAVTAPAENIVVAGS
jgi:hypothetical protein